MIREIFRTKENRQLFLADLIRGIRKDDISVLSAQAAYYMILALIPFLIFVINILLFFVKDYMSSILGYLRILPRDILNFLNPLIEKILQGGDTTVLSLGLIFSLWSASKGVGALLKAVDKAFDLKAVGGFVKMKLKGILFTLMIVAMIFLVLGLLAFGDLILLGLNRLVPMDLFNNELRFLMKGVIPLLVMILGFTLFYRYGPSSSQKITLSEASAGATVTTLGWLILTFLYGIYMNNFSKMSVTYGPLVGIMALFIWLNLSSLLVILGAEVVASLYAFRMRKEEVEKEFL